MPLSQLPEVIESHRDRAWCREPELRVEDPIAAEKLIDRVGFCSVLTDSRRPGPSLYIAVCGRRDAHLPRNLQKDPESHLAWTIKDEILRRGRVYYAKLRGTRSIFVARRLVPHFYRMAAVQQRTESRAKLSDEAGRVFKVLRKEWEMGSRDLRNASGIKNRSAFNRALIELQRAFKVIPSEVIYEPVFSYIWTLADTRFHDELQTTVSNELALTEIARAYLNSAGMTWRGELARVSGLSNPDAGLGNWALVDEGFARRLGPGIYVLPELARLIR